MPILREKDFRKQNRHLITRTATLPLQYDLKLWNYLWRPSKVFEAICNKHELRCPEPGSQDSITYTFNMHININTVPKTMRHTQGTNEGIFLCTI